MKNIITFLIVIASLFSCSEKEEDFEALILNNTNTVNYIINAQITNNLSSHYVIISNPKTVTENTKIEGISGADIIVSSDTETFQFTELPQNHPIYEEVKIKSGIYKSDVHFKGIPNTLYTITVKIGNETFTASDKMPIPEEAPESELDLVKNSINSDFFGEEKTSIWVNGDKGKEMLYHVLSGDLNFFNRQRPESMFISTQPTNPIKLSSRNKLFRYTYSQNYQDYVWGYLSQTRWSIDNIISTEPGKLNSNFNSPEISGYFSAISNTIYNGNNFELLNVSFFETEKQYQANYDVVGNIKIRFMPSGECLLEGLNTSIQGTYDLGFTTYINEGSKPVIKMYFDTNNLGNSTILYGFFITQISLYPPLEHEENNDTEGFYYTNLESITSKNNVVWIQ